MKYSTFQSNVKKELGRSNSEIDALIDAWTNDFIKQVYRTTNLWLARRLWERDITQGKRSWAMPELITNPSFFYYLDSDGESWREVPVKGMREAILRYSPEDEGTPSLIVLGKSAFDVFPLPDTTYKIRAHIKAYEEELTTTDAANQESDLINEFYDLVLNGVLEKGYRYLEQYDDMRESREIVKTNMVMLKRQNAMRTLSGEMTLWPSDENKGRESR